MPSGAPLRFRILARGESVSIHEWHCAGHGPTQPAEEATDAYELVIARRGAFQWDIAGERMLAHPGIVTFLHPAEGYRVRHPVGGGDAGAYFRLSASATRELLAEHDPRATDRDRPRFPGSHTPLDGRAYLLHRLAVRAALLPEVGALEIEERTLAFLRAALAQAYQRWTAASRPSARQPGRLGREYAERVAEVIAVRYREPLTLADVARAVGVSPFHLSRLVRATTGVPIYRMVIRRRLRDAMEQLLETRDSISAIALGLGFASHSHLTDAFRREFGVPPSALRSPARRYLGIGLESCSDSS